MSVGTLQSPQQITPVAPELPGAFPAGTEILVAHYFDLSAQVTTSSTVFVSVGLGSMLFDQFIAEIPSPPAGWEIIYRFLANIRNDVVSAVDGVEAQLISNTMYGVTAGTPVSNSLVSRIPGNPSPGGADTGKSAIMRPSDATPIDTDVTHGWQVQLRTTSGANAARLLAYMVAAYWRKL